MLDVDLWARPARVAPGPCRTSEGVAVVEAPHGRRRNGSARDGLSVDDGRNGIQSVEMAMRVLQALEGGSGPMSLSAVAAASGMAPSKAHRYLVSLGRIGLTMQDPLSGLYDFGAGMRRLGAEALRRTNEVAVVSRHAMTLRDLTGHSVNVAIWGDQGPLVVNWAYGGRPLPLTVRVGANLPLLSSSIGRVYLAHLADSVLAHKLDGELATAAGATWSRRRIDVLRQQVRRQGYAVTVGGVIPGVASVAAPVFTATDPLPLALSVVMPEADGGPDNLPSICEKVLAVSSSASVELGHRSA